MQLVKPLSRLYRFGVVKINEAERDRMKMPAMAPRPHDHPVLLIHPPAAKPSEPPAGLARLAGALGAHGAPHRVVDANLEGMLRLLEKSDPGKDTWSRRALMHRDRHLEALRTPATYDSPDRYRRAVADLDRLLSRAGQAEGIRAGLANYTDAKLSPVRTDDLLAAAREPERTPYFEYFSEYLLPQVERDDPAAVGISITYLSQALPAFALIGLLRRERPGLKIIAGGGLVTSWLARSKWNEHLDRLVDQAVEGPGEPAVLAAAGGRAAEGHAPPEYSTFDRPAYLSPGFVLPFSTSDGCWWNRCTFCPERSEGRRFAPLPRQTVGEQLRSLVQTTSPSMIHLVDNAVPPAVLRELAEHPPGAPWYGFARIGEPLDDPGFCERLAESGCRMLKLGLESGDQAVLDALGKGVDLGAASRVLDNLRRAGIATYVYLLFGTPAEDRAAAERTFRFVLDQGEAITFLNLAIFNLPLDSPEAEGLELGEFYDGDLALYSDFIHPRGWGRAEVRRFLDETFRKHSDTQAIIRRNPPRFTSNHAAFFSSH